jgi:hypothetical protein
LVPCSYYTNINLCKPTPCGSYSLTDLAHVTAKDKIISLQNGGYIHGVTNELFVPNATITAAQGVQLIVNALGLNLDLVKK